MKIDLRMVAVTIVMLLTITLLFNREFGISERSIVNEKRSISNCRKWTDDRAVDDLFGYLPPEPRRLTDCSDLFSGTPEQNFTYSDVYAKMSPDFDNVFAQTMALVKPNTLEGGTFSEKAQHLALHYMASRTNVKTVCETGFNAGHSSFNYLTANSRVTVHSFDIGWHPYTKAMSTYLQSKFQNRLFVHFGDSTETVPQFRKENPDVVCDLIFVDGGHNYLAAVSDLLNLAAMANVADGNVIVFDDYPTKWSFDQEFDQAWADIICWGYVREVFRCSSGPDRGFVAGVVVQRPRVITVDQ